LQIDCCDFFHGVVVGGWRAVNDPILRPAHLLGGGYCKDGIDSGHASATSNAQARHDWGKDESDPTVSRYLCPKDAQVDLCRHARDSGQQGRLAEKRECHW